MFKVGDIVARFSHRQDIFFHVDQIYANSEGEDSSILKGLNLRLLADAPVSDLVAKNPVEVAYYERIDNKMIYQKSFYYRYARSRQLQQDFSRQDRKLVHLQVTSN